MMAHYNKCKVYDGFFQTLVSKDSEEVCTNRKVSANRMKTDSWVMISLKDKDDCCYGEIIMFLRSSFGVCSNLSENWKTLNALYSTEGLEMNGKVEWKLRVEVTWGIWKTPACSNSAKVVCVFNRFGWML